MTKVGLVLVSHSAQIAQGLYQLIREVAKDIDISYVGGTEDGGIGTSFDRIQTAIEENPAQVLLTFYDLGSARMNLEMVSEFSEKDIHIPQHSLNRRRLLRSSPAPGRSSPGPGPQATRRTGHYKIKNVSNPSLG